MGINAFSFICLKIKTRPTKRAADGGESARFTGIFLASSFFYISSTIHTRPRPPLTQTVGLTSQENPHHAIQHRSKGIMKKSVLALGIILTTSFLIIGCNTTQQSPSNVEPTQFPIKTSLPTSTMPLTLTFTKVPTNTPKV